MRLPSTVPVPLKANVPKKTQAAAKCCRKGGTYMNDFVWFVIIAVIFVLLSYVFIRIGLKIGKEQKTDLIISYHCDKVTEENKPAFCKRMGLGMTVIGAGFALSGICTVILQSAFAFIPMAAGLVLGIALFISAMIKNNR